MDNALLAYLEALCARAYLVAYAPQESLRGALSRLFTHGIPRTVRRSTVPLFIGFLAIVLGAIVGYLLYFQDLAWFYSFVPSGLSDGREPGASAEYLRSPLFDQDTGKSEDLGTFPSLPSFVLTFYNGLIMGAFFAVFGEAGLAVELFGWLSIHGVT